MKTRRQCLRNSATKTSKPHPERERQRETKIAAMAKTSASALLWALAAARGSALIAPSTRTLPAHSTKTAPTHKTRLPPLHMGDWAEANAAKALDAQKRIVMKFGGSSIRDAERVTHVADLIASKIREGFTPAVVVSAMGTTTNELERAGALALVDGIVRVDEMRKLHLEVLDDCLLYTSPSPRDLSTSRMPSSA